MLASTVVTAAWGFVTRLSIALGGGRLHKRVSSGALLGVNQFESDLATKWAMKSVLDVHKHSLKSKLL
jgi:hypothetical protein